MGTAALADEVMFLTRHIVAAIAALATCVTAASSDGQPSTQALLVTCTNPASGATWQISIDYGRATVDANPARISTAGSPGTTPRMAATTRSTAAPVI